MSAFCECEGFQYALKMGVIKEGSHQVLNGKTGALHHVRYYFLGPKDIRKSLIFEFCPACGQRVEVNAAFLADPIVFPALAQAEASQVSGDLWRHVKTGGEYRELYRFPAPFSTLENQTATYAPDFADGFISALSTDSIATGEQIVVYQSLENGRNFARPAELFDDGRFVRVQEAR